MTAWVQKYGTPLYITSVADYTADFQVPALRAGGVEPGRSSWSPPTATDRPMSASAPAASTKWSPCREPYQMQGYQAIDELNRAFHGQPPSRLAPDALSGDPENINAEGGDKNTFIPSNGYERAYLDDVGREAVASARGHVDFRDGSRTGSPLAIRGLTKRFGGTLCRSTRVDWNSGQAARCRRCWARTAPASRR